MPAPRLLLGLVALVGSVVLQDSDSAELQQGVDRKVSGAADCSYASLYPRQYVCYKTADLSPDSLDGDLTKQAWREVPWTEDFVDISTDTTPRLRTRAKMRWDDSYLYIAAELEEPQIWATLTEDDTVIFKDNDFEVFVDANGTNHFYKEFEMNALNKRWSLVLNKPYGDGGYENSTRVSKDNGWSMLPGTKSAVKIMPSGALNDPSVKGRAWTVEVALPLADLAYNSTSAMPAHGTFWRIGFSRVEWNVEVNSTANKYVKTPKCQSCPKPGDPHEDNWVWSPQGVIAMHNPELWGILQFSTAAVNSTAVARYDEWPSRSAAMAVYWAEKAFAKDHGGSYSANLAELLPYSSPPFQLCASARTEVELPRTGGFRAVVQSEGSPWGAVVTDDRRLTTFVASSDSRQLGAEPGAPVRSAAARWGALRLGALAATALLAAGRAWL